MLANMANLRYHLRLCLVTAILQGWWIKNKSFLSLVIVLTSSSGTNYVPNEQEDGDQYGSFTIPSKIMPSYSYPENLVDQNEIPIDLSR